MIKLKEIVEVILKQNSKLEIVDLRDPNWIPNEYDKKELNRTMVNINNGKIFLYRWGRNGNKIKWDDVIDQAGDHNNMMLLTNNKNLILPDSLDSTKWGGSRNIYTDTTHIFVKNLLDSGIINSDSKIYIGNWARGDGRFIGKAKEIGVTPKQIPSKLVLYHGTSSDRLENIKKDGLKPMPKEFRPWKSDVLKHHPEYREHAIYLTIDKFQADYYAKKAVKVARRSKMSGVYPVVLKIIIPKSHYKYLLPDDDYFQLQFMKLGMSWMDSLKDFSQVAYLGSIPPEWISIAAEKTPLYKNTIVKETDEDDENQIDIDRLYYNDWYLDDVAEEMGYDDNFTKQFWNQRYIPTLYHCTTKENYEFIKTKGLIKKSDTRGASSNRHIGPSVFTTQYDEEVSYLKSYYGPIVIAINTKQMKLDGFTPPVEKEPDWARAEKLSFIFNKLGKETELNGFIDNSDGTNQGTVIVYANIPPKYLSLTNL